MRNSQEHFLDDPVKTAEAITIGGIAAFAAVREIVPQHQVGLITILGIGDFLYNAANVYILRNRQNETEPAYDEGLENNLNSR